MTRRIVTYCLVWLVCVTMSACRESLVPAGDDGSVSLSFTTDEQTNTKADDRPYRVEITSAGGRVVYSNDDHRTINGNISLSAGVYTIVASNGVNPQAGTTPYYQAKEDFTVVKGANVALALTAKLANVKVAVDFSQIVRDNFEVYCVEVKSGQESTWEKLVFDKNSTEMVGYISSTGIMRWDVRLINKQDPTNVYAAGKTISDVKPRDSFVIKVDINPNESGDENGAGLLGLTVIRNVDEYEHTYELNLSHTKTAPTIHSMNFDLNQMLLVNQESRGVSVPLEIRSQALLAQFNIFHHNDVLTALGVPGMINLVDCTPEQAAAMNGAGIIWNSDIATNAVSMVDFSGLFNKMPLGEYIIDIEAYDNLNQLAMATIRVTVVPNQDHLTGSAEAGAKYVVIKGEYCTVDKPEDMAFQYRKQGDTEWMLHSDIEMGEGKKFSARIVDIAPQTKYEYRTYSTAAGDKQGLIYTFTTDEAPDIPNLDFEKGHWNGKSFYPNESGGNSYWGTGNDGLTSTLAGGRPSNTYPVDEPRPGSAGTKALTMVSQGGVPIVGHAAGNLFAGYFEFKLTTDPNTMKTFVKFGRPYTGRPLGLKVWYKYHAEPITECKFNSDMRGKPDMMHIYISLEDWGSSGSRPSRPTVIGYGELKSGEEVTEYRQHTIPITYYDKFKKPTHVVLTATSSYLGGDFCGGVGSALTIDDFELVWF